MIIPFFIPHSGCPHQCVFCNQKNITGQFNPIDPPAIPQKVLEYLDRDRTNSPVQVAFFGGTFTALPLKAQQAYLDAVQPFIRSGRVQSIRLSTRPDYITSEILNQLQTYQVKTVELGVQSMDDSVLKLSGRGHTAADTVTAVKLVKEYGFSIGLQLMPGLPGDTEECFEHTVEKTVKLKPDFVRIYPALVIKGTPLEELYRIGRYAPLSLDDAVMRCHNALVRFERAEIAVIRIGLQPTEELEKPGSILAGPYHPAFRQLVESSIFLDKMRSVLRERKETGDAAVLQVNRQNLSAAIGQRRSNVETLKKEFNLEAIRILGSDQYSKRSVYLRPATHREKSGS